MCIPFHCIWSHIKWCVNLSCCFCDFFENLYLWCYQCILESKPIWLSCIIFMHILYSQWTFMYIGMLNSPANSFSFKIPAQVLQQCIFPYMSQYISMLIDCWLLQVYDEVVNSTSFAVLGWRKLGNLLNDKAGAAQDKSKVTCRLSTAAGSYWYLNNAM